MLSPITLKQKAYLENLGVFSSPQAGEQSHSPLCLRVWAPALTGKAGEYTWQRCNPARLKPRGRQAELITLRENPALGMEGFPAMALCHPLWSISQTWKLLYNPGMLETKRHEGSTDLPQNQATGPVQPGNLEYGSASIKTPNKEAYL